MNEPTTVLEQPVEPAEPILNKPSQDEQLVEEDLLVEEVSIDGMCGVY
jgi:mycofactocin precursor